MIARSWYQRRFGWVPRPVRQVIILVIGGTLLLLAIAGMLLPIVPGFIFLPLALAILAAEFAWAATWLKKLKKGANNVHDRIKASWNGSTTTSPAASKSDQTVQKANDRSN